jgi:hypothetical protein
MRFVGLSVLTAVTLISHGVWRGHSVRDEIRPRVAPHPLCSAFGVASVSAPVDPNLLGPLPAQPKALV